MEQTTYQVLTRTHSPAHNSRSHTSHTPHPTPTLTHPAHSLTQSPQHLTPTPTLTYPAHSRDPHSYTLHLTHTLQTHSRDPTRTHLAPNTHTHTHCTCAYNPQLHSFPHLTHPCASHIAAHNPHISRTAHSQIWPLSYLTHTVPLCTLRYNSLPRSQVHIRLFCPGSALQMIAEGPLGLS